MSKFSHWDLKLELSDEQVGLFSAEREGRLVQISPFKLTVSVWSSFLRLNLVHPRQSYKGSCIYKFVPKGSANGGEKRE